MIHPNGAVGVLVHYFVGGLIACMPNLEQERLRALMNKPQPVIRSDDVRAVTCTFCKQADAYQRAANALRALGVKVS